MFDLRLPGLPLFFHRMGKSYSLSYDFGLKTVNYMTFSFAEMSRDLGQRKSVKWAYK
jgi:hypothetical protein